MPLRRLDPSVLFALLVGAATPLLIIGRSFTAGAVVLAVAAAYFVTRRPPLGALARAAMVHPLGIMVLLVCLCWVPSVVVSPLPLKSLQSAARILLFVAAAYVVWQVMVNDDDVLKRALKTLLAGSFAAVGLALLSVDLLPRMVLEAGMIVDHANALRMGSREFGAVSVLTVPVVIWAGFRLGGGWRFVAVLCVLMFVALNWLTHNRAPLAGLLAAAAAVAVMLAVNEKSRGWALPVLGATGVAVVVMIFWIRATRLWMVPEAPEGDWFLPLWLIDFERQTMWAHTWKIFLDNPWFGFGINTVNFSPGADVSMPGSHELKIIPAHPHNWAVEVLAETGVIGFVPFLVTLVYFSWRHLVAYRQTDNPAYLAAVALAAGYWVSGLFNFSYWSSWWQMLFFLLAAISLAGAGKSESHGGTDNAAPTKIRDGT